MSLLTSAAGALTRRFVPAVAGPLLPSFAVAQPLPGQPGDPSCSRSLQEGVLTQHFSTSAAFAGGDVTYSVDVLDANEIEHLHRRAHAVSLGERTLLRVEETIGEASLSVRLEYGPEVSGVREVRLETRDAETFSGELDGRPLAPFPKDAPASAIRFADGSPMPAFAVPASFTEAVAAAYETAARDVPKCLARLGAPAPSPLPPTGGPRETDPEAGTNGVGFSPRNPKHQEQCVLCIAGCFAAAGVCGATATKAALACGPFYPLCLAAGLAGCAIGHAVCLSTCRKVGGPCCPQMCYPKPGYLGIGLGCCASGDQCLDPSRGVCCGNSLEAKPCHQRSCCAPTDTCLDAGTCCPQGRQPCGADRCCAPGSTCVGGECCPPDRACGDQCCADGSVCDQAARICCSIFSTTCGGVCCAPGDSCVAGKCCPQQRVCGPVCCPPGGYCADPQTGRCGGCQPPDLPCGTGCCYFENACCSGTCCRIGQICCTGTRPCVDPGDYYLYCAPR